MPLAAGVRLGPYEILAPLGAGGMGEVFRARDERLGRDVAIKVLRQDVVANPDRLRRFEQEARAASALNHPAIVTIYDIGRADGIVYVAMEYVGGETLRGLLGKGAQPVRRVVDIAARVAEGLAAAHRAGIVHRDIKPENVMVTNDGLVKILDFGLAKVRGDSATATTLLLTSEGTVLGTVAYMSPEQARGEQVDHRSDQFSLGVVLYEMLTGVRPFTRASAPQTLAAIIESEPEPAGRLNRAVVAPLTWILERCLAKDVRDRYESTLDLARDLAAVRDRGSEVLSGATQATLVSPASRHRRPLAAAALAGAALLTAGGYFAGARATPPRALPSFRQLTFQRGFIQAARFSPDGQTVVYGGSWDGGPLRLHTVRLDAPESRPLSLPPAGILAVSNHGEIAMSRDCAYWNSTGSCPGTLARASLGGGSHRDVLTDVVAADWTTDGQQLVVARRADRRTRLELPPGKALYEAQGLIAHVRFSPDGRRLAFFESRAAEAEVVALDLSGTRTVLSGGWQYFQGLAWSPDGGEVWFTATRQGETFVNQLYAVDLRGALRVLYRQAGPVRLTDVSPDGRMLVTRGLRRRVTTLRRQGQSADRDVSWFAEGYASAVTPDGRFLLFDERGEAVRGISTMFLRELGGGDPARLGQGRSVAISADGQWVLSVPSDAPSRLVLVPTAAGEPRTLERGTIEEFDQVRFLPGRRAIVVVGHVPGAAEPSLFLQDLDQGPPKPLSFDTCDGCDVLTSPTGEQVIADGRDGKVWRLTLATGTREELRALARDDALLEWTSDGRGVYVFERSGVGAQVTRVDLASGHRTIEHEVSVDDPVGWQGPTNMVITPDGRTLIYDGERRNTDLFVATGIK